MPEGNIAIFMSSIVNLVVSGFVLLCAAPFRMKPRNTIYNLSVQDVKNNWLRVPASR